MKEFIDKKRKRSNEEVKFENFKFDTGTEIKDIKIFEPIEIKYKQSLIDLSKNENIEDIILKNNIEPEIIYKYLTKHSENSNDFEYLKEALTSEYYKKLYKNKRNNPLTLILKIFNEIINKNEKEVNKILKTNIKFIEYNLPLIYGIERVRFNYYLWLIKTKINYDVHFAEHMSEFSDFLKFLNSLNHEEKCDQKEIDMIFYQFILEITEVVYLNAIKIDNIPTLYNKINPNFIELENLPIDAYVRETNLNKKQYVKKIKNGQYYITNGIENITVEEKNYNIEKLANDIYNYPYYPLKLLLYRNESIQYYYSKNKTFIERENEELFLSFKNYFFEFITSENFKNVISHPEFKYVNEFLNNNNNFQKILLNDKYLKFIPFYTEQFSGFTNKDLLLTTISAYPSIVKIIPKKFDKDNYENIQNFCLLMSIGEKFFSLLHEQPIHFIYGYLHHLTDKKNINIKMKKIQENEKNNEDDDISEDGDNFFEKQLFGKIVRELTITNVIALLDGESTKKTNQEFKEIFNADLNKKKLMNMINKCSGFLKLFLNKFPINFENLFKIIKDLKSTYISIKGKTEPYIELPLFVHFDYIKYRNSIKE